MRPCSWRPSKPRSKSQASTKGTSTPERSVAPSRHSLPLGFRFDSARPRAAVHAGRRPSLTGPKSRPTGHSTTLTPIGSARMGLCRRILSGLPNQRPADRPRPFRCRVYGTVRAPNRLCAPAGAGVCVLMAELLAFVGVMVGSGYVLRTTALVRADMAKDLSTAVFYFTLPPLIFLEIHRAELSWSLLILPAVAWGVALGGSLVGLALCRAFKLPKALAGALVIVTVFGNTTFFGYPVLQGFYGSRGLTLAIFFDLLGASLATNTVAVVLASAAGGDGSIDVRQIARKLLLFPPIWGLGLGLALRGVALPSLLAEILTRIGNLTTPLIMLSIGLSLQLSAWRQDLKWVAVATVGKLLVVPLAVFLILSAIGLPSELLQVSVLQAAMPTMFFSLTLALLFGLRLHLVVNAIMVSTLLSFATLPLWRWIVG
ncbi:MAG TPA: hypothetical protein DFS52_20180 [Myxococcales bacterium]|nr:hypothetical protein [Myxococcales bacterium]